MQPYIRASFRVMPETGSKYDDTLDTKTVGASRIKLFKKHCTMMMKTSLKFALIRALAKEGDLFVSSLFQKCFALLTSILDLKSV